MKIENNKKEHLTNEVLDEDINNNILYNSLGNDNLEQKKSNKLNLSLDAKNLLIMRIVIIALAFIYIPMEIILEKQLSKIEIVHFFPSMNNTNSKDFGKKNFFLTFSDFIENILIDKDTIMIYTSIIYVLYHPIIGLKISIVMQIFYYFGIILKCIIQSKRPSWLLDEEIKICSTSYSNPSGSFFIFSFFYLYSLISFRTAYKEKKNLYSFIFKISVFSIYLVILILSCVIYLLYRLHFIFEIIYTLCLALLSITIILDFDKLIQKNLLKKLKNIFKARKHKIRIFLMVFGIEFLAIIVYFFITENNNLSEVEDKISNSNNCSQTNKDELGLQKTFKNITYAFGIIGAFWGACFTIEYNIGKWWNTNLIQSIIKVIIILISSFTIQYSFNKIDYVTYEFNFVVESVKYFLFYYVNFGLVPLFFSIIKLTQLNKYENDNKKRKIMLFKPSIFVLEKEIKIDESINEIKID